jgi:hypothetical protein
MTRWLSWPSVCIGWHAGDGPRKVIADMRNLDVVVSDLEWQRLRRRVAGNAAEALFFNCGTWALIAVLKLVAR